MINLGSTTDGPDLAQAIAVSPTNSHTIAVALNEDTCCSSSGPLEFFTDSTKLANSISTPAINQLSFASGTTLYGYYPDIQSQVTVSSTGGTLTQQWSDLVEGNTFQYSGGLVFGSNGEEFNPATGLLEGTFDVGSTCCSSGPQVLPDSAINRAFALGQTPFFNSFGITSYNLSEFTPLAVASLAELAPELSSTSKFIQWGPNGSALSSPPIAVAPRLLLRLCWCKAQPCSSLPARPSILRRFPFFRHSGRDSRKRECANDCPWHRICAEFQRSTAETRLFSAKYVNETEMTVYVPKAAVAAPGTAAIVVKNPTPGGGKSKRFSPLELLSKVRSSMKAPLSTAVVSGVFFANCIPSERFPLCHPERSRTASRASRPAQSKDPCIPTA